MRKETAWEIEQRIRMNRFNNNKKKIGVVKTIIAFFVIYGVYLLLK